MKTNPNARRFLKVRGFLFCVAFAGMAALSFTVGEMVAERAGQAVAHYVDVPRVPSVSLADLMACAR
jgi:hypothetical protein